MPLCRTNDDLHPKQYSVGWNGAIEKQLQIANQRDPPPKTHHIWAITKADELDILRHARRLSTFTLYDLDAALQYEYGMAALQRLVTRWVRESRVLKLARGTGEKTKYKYLVDERQGDLLEYVLDGGR